MLVCWDRTDYAGYIFGGLLGGYRNLATENTEVAEEDIEQH